MAMLMHLLAMQAWTILSFLQGFTCWMELEPTIEHSFNATLQLYCH